MDTVLVTGGAGFIGSNVAKHFASKGHKVRVLDDLSTGYKKNLDGLDVEFIKGDVRDAGVVRKATRGVDAVLHLAASVGRQKSLSNPGEDAQVNLVGTTVLLEEARKAGVKAFVYSSSAAIFGELQNDLVGEDHPLNPDSPYGVSKLAAEKQVLCFGALYNIKVVCLRYFNVYGENQRFDVYGNVIPIFAKRLFSGQPLIIYGDGEQTRDFVNVQDVVMANYLAAASDVKAETLNIGSGSSITINHLAELMFRLSGVQGKIEYAPVRPADVRHCKARIDKAASRIGYHPAVRLEDGLSAYLEWYRKNEVRKPA